MNTTLCFKGKKMISRELAQVKAMKIFDLEGLNDGFSTTPGMIYNLINEIYDSHTSEKCKNCLYFNREKKTCKHHHIGNPQVPLLIGFAGCGMWREDRHYHKPDPDLDFDIND